MDDRPIAKPDHLHASAPVSEWLGKHVAAATALVLGALALIVVIVSQDQLWATPDWRISVPGLIATAIAATASVVRRERASALWLIGLGLAGTAVVLGWLVMLAIVIGATLALILILHSVM